MLPFSLCLGTSLGNVREHWCRGKPGNPHPITLRTGTHGQSTPACRPVLDLAFTKIEILSTWQWQWQETLCCLYQESKTWIFYRHQNYCMTSSGLLSLRRLVWLVTPSFSHLTRIWWWRMPDSDSLPEIPKIPGSRLATGLHFNIEIKEELDLPLGCFKQNQLLCDTNFIES